MCILFLFFDPHNIYGRFKFVLASNRDEIYSRESIPAKFWNSKGHDVLSGLDVKSGGTWLGINTNGKFSVVTNYLQPYEDPSFISRGKLVSDYLTSNISAHEYLCYLSERGHLYNGFNLLTASFSNESDELYYYSNRSCMAPERLETGIYGLSNSLLDISWPKVCIGKRLFTDIIHTHKNDLNQELLTTELLEMLNDTSQLPIDPRIEEQGQDFVRPMIKEFSSICVRANGYGTKTNTIVTIDNNYRVNFIEKTVTGTDTKETEISKYTFNLSS
nr:T10 protein [Oriental turtle dovepox virus]